MKKLLTLTCMVAAVFIIGCNNDASDGATTTDSNINKSDSRRNTDVTTDPLQDTASTKFDPQKTGGTPTKPNNLR